MPPPETQVPLTGDEFRRLRLQLDEILSQMEARRLDRGRDAAEALARMHQQVVDLFKEIRDRVERDRRTAQAAINTLVRVQTAQGLAPRFLTERQPYKADAELSAMIADGLLYHGSFIQKPPFLLAFYRRLFAGMDRPPARLLEIGVKGGGSTTFWKVLFPEATVVGFDLKLRLLDPEASSDGVIYLQGDQTDVERLREVAARFGPFDLVIDDGSHVAAHQATTLRALLPCVVPGGIYVIEDTHADQGASSADLADDMWAAFVLTCLQRLRRASLPPASPGVELARGLMTRIDEVTIARQVLAIRAKDPSREHA